MTFRARQFALAAHLRDPDANAPPTGIEPRRLGVYRELFFNNVHTFMRNAFPVIRRTIGDDAMRGLVRAWYAGHRAHTPLFPRMPSEFVAWLESAPDAAATLPPWLAELAHYEWLETELDLADAEIDGPGIDRAGDLMTGVPVLSPVARAVAYEWPVHRIAPDFQPAAPQPVTLLVYRDRSDTVRFIETNLVTHELLRLVGDDDGATGAQLLDAVALSLSHADPAALRRAGEKALTLLRDKDVIAGVRAPAAAHTA